MKTRWLLAIASAMVLLVHGFAKGQFMAKDPGPRSGGATATMLTGLTPTQQEYFTHSMEAFGEADGVGDGLGPRFNLDSCAGCHSHPATGGSSGPINPQVAMATAFGAKNVVPSFLTLDGPIREARFKYKADGSRDGGVHGLFVISGRRDPTGNASDCTIRQDDFADHVARGNVVFRIPTPVFGVGLIEHIPDATILAGLSARGTTKATMGIQGRPNRVATGNANRSSNDGTVARFGWKAQNKSLLIFAGEAYNVEQGISNELFPTERDETPACQYATVPNDTTNTDGVGIELLSDIEKFAIFMRFLAPPRPSSDTPGGATSIGRGKSLFEGVGCALCHTPTLRTGPAAVAALRNQPVPLYSDLLLHRMGTGLADDILQGDAGPDEFRTAPLWGLGHRLFFLHDGRARDLRDAIAAHRSSGSEANRVVERYLGLNESQKQDLFNFLRSL